MRLPRIGRDVEIKHPSPRRLGSCLLLQRSASMATSIGPRSFSDSPGPPPAKSPLRFCRDPTGIEGIITTPGSGRRATPKMAPSIRSVSEHASESEMPIIIPSVITECTGPIKRPKSRDRNPLKHPLYPISKKEREERTRQRKIRDKPGFSRTIDSIVNDPTLPARRLRKARPQIQIPDFRPAPLTTRASSSASSNASWKKITENTLSPVSTAPYQEEKEKSCEEPQASCSPTSPSVSNGSPNSAVMALSPVMLVAEEVPPPKARNTPKPPRLILRGEGTKYAPRPRSASISRTAIKRRSRGSIGNSRPSSPDTSKPPAKKDDTPPLPSPPPNRALPPTPPISGTDATRKVKRPSPSDGRAKDLPLPPHSPLSPAPLQPRHNHSHNASLSKPLPHITTQDLRTTTNPPTASSSSSSNATSRRLDARIERLEALERRNALLHAALMAVLQTNGALNNAGPLAGRFGDALEGERAVPMVWESRVARRSGAVGGRGSSGEGDGEASLELYLSTRREVG